MKLLSGEAGGLLGSTSKTLIKPWAAQGGYEHPFPLDGGRLGWGWEAATRP